jgi:hypothetical protein
VGDFNNDGIPDAALLAQAGAWLFTGMGGGTFNPPVLTPVQRGQGNEMMVATDFNRDGNLDLAVTVQTGFVVLLGNGKGSFQSQTISTPSTVSFLACGDLNQDGRPDVALSSTNATQVYLYFSKSGGGFSPPATIDLPGGKALAIGDVNGDGIADLVSAAGYIAFGKGGSTFKPPFFYPVISYDPTTVVLADLRNNGRIDIVANFSVLLNLGNGQFEDGERMSMTGGGDCSAGADFNRDGKSDLAVGTTQGVAILLGSGKTRSPFTKGPVISGVVGCPYVGDFNGDGIPDLLIQVVGGGGAGTMECYLGNGDGTFTFASSTAILTRMGEVGFGDFNHDGKLDFALAGDWMVLGNGDGTFQTPTNIPGAPGEGHTGITVGDLNNDGWPDLTISDPLAPYIYILINDKVGGFTMTQEITLQAVGAFMVVLGDVNSDGNLDMLISTEGGLGVSFYVGDGTGMFKVGRKMLDPPTAGSWLAYVDVNGDGIPDIEAVEGNDLAICLGKGHGAFAPPFYIGTGPSPGPPVFENLHGQPTGFPDILLADLSGELYVLSNTTKR